MEDNEKREEERRGEMRGERAYHNRMDMKVEHHVSQGNMIGNQKCCREEGLVGLV